MTTFKEYVLGLDPESAETPQVQDFISDTKWLILHLDGRDRGLPDVKSLSELHAYMSYRRNAPQDALDAAEQVWADYAASCHGTDSPSDCSNFERQMGSGGIS